MSGSKKKQLKFKEVGASNGKNDIPETNDPMAIAMAGGKDGADRTQAEFQKTPIRDRTATDEQYPTADLTAEDPRDAVMQAKMELQDPAKPGITPFGQLVAKDSDFKWLQKKRDQEAEANFQQWFASNFDKMSVTEKKLARELYPQFYEQRLKLLDKDLDVLRRLARQNVTGIQTREDLLLQYAVEAGFINASRLENLLHPEKAAHLQEAETRKKMFVRGLFNPRRLPRDGNASKREISAHSVTNRNDTVALPAAKYGLTGGAGVSAYGAMTMEEERVPQNRKLAKMAGVPI